MHAYIHTHIHSGSLLLLERSLPSLQFATVRPCVRKWLFNPAPLSHERLQLSHIDFPTFGAEDR